MSSQTVNYKLWSKLFIEIGVTGIVKQTGVATNTLYKIKNENFVPAASVQRKLRDGLKIDIEEMFPFSIADQKAA